MLSDTTVVSKLIRKSPAVAVWAAGYPLEDLFFSAVGEAELRYGAAILPTDRRRETLVLDLETMLRDAFGNRVLPFDSDAAREYADIAAMRRSAGRPVAPADCQIAAIARSRNMAVAMREVFPFYAALATGGVTDFLDGARLVIDEPTVLTQVVSQVNDLHLDRVDADTKGDLFEHVLRQY